jgi:hypothetical protein
VKFTGDNSKTTYENIGQFLAQVSDFGINSMHKIRLFPLSLSSMTFNWFISLPSNSIDTWKRLEQKFHDYFYNGESKLRLSHLVAIKQKPNENVAEYMKRFRETYNKCYGLTIREKDLPELAFAGLNAALKDRLEGQDFTDMNQVLQWALSQDNRSKDHKVHGWFKETSTKDKPSINWVSEDASREEDSEVCVAEWVDMP